MSAFFDIDRSSTGLTFSDNPLDITYAPIQDEETSDESYCDVDYDEELSLL